jgi:hypothetical protein
MIQIILPFLLFTEGAAGTGKIRIMNAIEDYFNYLKNKAVLCYWRLEEMPLR